MRVLDSNEAGFAESVATLIQDRSDNLDSVGETVRSILADVRARGDACLLELTARFDHLECQSIAGLTVTAVQMQAAADRIDPLVLDALLTSIKRVRDYHERQKEALGGTGTWEYTDAYGNRLGQVVRPMQRVGIYAPGGKANYPSTIVMTAIPARVAGVGEIVLTVPAPGGELSDVLLAAAHLCGVDEMYLLGGAQAIGALAYGTGSIARVDKIVGPGNAYVAAAKKMVFGDVGIDMVAGPSEVVIVADDSANVDWLVMDLFAQAEHDEDAQAVLISRSRQLVERVADAVRHALPKMARKQVIEASLRARGALIVVADDEEAVSLVNTLAPEHLELAVDNADELLGGITHAGAIFVGHYSAEVVGDYTAGPSHVLPTAGTTRFASPLGVYDFLTRSSLVRCSYEGSVVLGRTAAILATEEGLTAHAAAASARVTG